MESLEKRTCLVIRNAEKLYQVQKQLQEADLPFTMRQIFHTCIEWMHRRGAVDAYLLMVQDARGIEKK